MSMEVRRIIDRNKRIHFTTDPQITGVIQSNGRWLAGGRGGVWPATHCHESRIVLIQALQTIKFSDIFSLPLAKPSKIGTSYKQCEGKGQTKGRSRITVLTHMGRRDIVPAVVNLGSRQRRDQLHVPSALLPRKGPLKWKLDILQKKELFSY